jgi:hypothetical protein
MATQDGSTRPDSPSVSYAVAVSSRSVHFGDGRDVRRAQQREEASENASHVLHNNPRVIPEEKWAGHVRRVGAKSEARVSVRR